MEWNSENTSDASRVVLEGKFLLLLSVFVTRNKTFWPMQNYFVLHFFTFFYFFFSLHSLALWIPWEKRFKLKKVGI